MNLLHLVGEQTIQNLLPVLALRPQRVIQVRSANERFVQAAGRLRRAVEVMAHRPGFDGYAPEFCEVVTASAEPGVDETRRKVGEALSLWPDAVVNLTGGTKMMAIGAYLAAEYQGETLLYCDTAAKKFVCPHRQQSLPKMASFDEVAGALPLEAIFAAHGLDPERVQAEIPSDAGLAFGSAVGALHHEAPEEVGRLAQKLREQINPEGRKLQKSKVDAVMAAGLPGPDGAVERRFFEAAASSGYLAERAGRFFYVLPDTATTTKARLHAVLKLNKMLVGGWFELLVAERMKESGKFLDLRCEVQSSDRSDGVLGENDIVAVDRDRFSLVFVSCKVSDGHFSPLEHVFATQRRAQTFGGAFARSVFCVGRFTDQNRRDIMRQACDTLRVKLCEGIPDFG